ncbi:MAG: hypothetical protein WHS38_01560 [Thermodesulforhabdaceae bacterium]
MKRTLLFILCALIIWGCGGSIIPKAPPIEYHQLNYSYHGITPLSCSAIQDKVLKVWSFHAASPFDSTEMVVESGNFQVSVSRSHQWIDRPGTLLAEWIRKDIDRDGMFSGAYETIETSGKMIGMELSGVVERWSWVNTEKGYYAVMEVTITVWQKQPKASILFKKHYEMKSQPVSTNNPEAFAQKITELTEQLSKTFRKELYEILAKELCHGSKAEH